MYLGCVFTVREVTWGTVYCCLYEMFTRKKREEMKVIFLSGAVLEEAGV